MSTEGKGHSLALSSVVTWNNAYAKDILSLLDRILLGKVGWDQVKPQLFKSAKTKFCDLYIATKVVEHEDYAKKVPAEIRSRIDRTRPLWWMKMIVSFIDSCILLCVAHVLKCPLYMHLIGIRTSSVLTSGTVRQSILDATRSRATGPMTFSLRIQGTRQTPTKNPYSGR